MYMAPGGAPASATSCTTAYMTPVISSFLEHARSMCISGPATSTSEGVVLGRGGSLRTYLLNTFT